MELHLGGTGGRPGPEEQGRASRTRKDAPRRGRTLYLQSRKRLEKMAGDKR